MFENVLVGIDGTSGGQDAIALAKQLVSPEGRITLANVHVGRLNPIHGITPGMISEERAAAVDLLRRERDSAHLTAQVIEIESGSAGRGLHQQAEDQRADLIVVGSCRRGAFGRAMLGDETRASLNAAPCAVAVARAGYAVHTELPAKIGVGHDGSPESEVALAAARELAGRMHARVLALEAISLPVYAYTGLVPPLVGDSVDALLKQAEERLAKLGADVEGHARYGVAGEELSSFGDELDLLIVGSRGYGPLRRLLLGSTSDYLARHAHCSLLAMPRAADVGEQREQQQAEQEAVGSPS